MSLMDAEACIVRWRGPLLGFLAGRGPIGRASRRSLAPRHCHEPGTSSAPLQPASRLSPQVLEPEVCQGSGYGSDDGALLRAEVDCLPERERGAILAYYFGEATTSQVAVLIGTSERAVEGLLHRARRRIAGRPSVQSQEHGRSTAVREGDQHQPSAPPLRTRRGFGGAVIGPHGERGAVPKGTTPRVS